MSNRVYLFFSEADKAIMSMIILFAVCELLIQLAGLHFNFPFITKRISKIMFDIVIFSRFISIFPLIHYKLDFDSAILYNLFCLIPLIIIFITEKKAAEETPKQGIVPFLIIMTLYIAASVLTNYPNTIMVTDINIDYERLLINTTIIGIVVNLIISAVYIKHKRNGGSPLLTAVSLFIVTTPPIFTIILFGLLLGLI
jgi:predicted neutral ceramidase superfamily lipid hydrolase